MRLAEQLAFSQFCVESLFLHRPHLADAEILQCPVNMIDLKILGCFANNALATQKCYCFLLATTKTIQLIYTLVLVVILAISCHMFMVV